MRILLSAHQCAPGAQWLRDAESMPASEMFCILSFHTVDLTDGPPASIFEIFEDRTCWKRRTWWKEIFRIPLSFTTTCCILTKHPARKQMSNSELIINKSYWKCIQKCRTIPLNVRSLNKRKFRLYCQNIFLFLTRHTAPVGTGSASN